MNDLYTANYHDEGPFFLSNFGQITRCVRIHGVHNEDAIDRNTDAVIAQTEMQKSESDESQNIFSAHSTMFKAEMDETESAITSQTKTIKDEGTDIRNAISAQTQTISDAITTNFGGKFDIISSKIETVSAKIEANTTGDATNSANIVNAINNVHI